VNPKMRHVIWWAAALILLIPALLSGVALDTVNRIDTMLTAWWDNFHDWAYQEER